MSDYQRLTGRKSTEKLDNYIHDTCSSCGGSGFYFPESGIPLHTVPCPKCNGTGLGKVNTTTASKGILIALILIGLGYTICKIFNL